MLPRTTGSLGLVGGMLLVGLLHGVWYLPLLLGTDLYHSAGSAFIIVPVFLGTLTLAGVFYGCHRIWSGSLWPVAVAHGALNTAWEFANGMMKTRTPLVTEHIGGESGAIMILGLPILDALLVRSILRSHF